MKRISAPPPLPLRPLDGHKGLFGRVLIVGGNENMVGAPSLAGLAALRMGSGLVEIAIPKSIVPAVLTIVPELIALGLGTAAANRDLMKAAEKADVIVLGPGLGQSPAAITHVKKLTALKDKLMVVDADALNILAAQKKWPTWFKADAVLTPHPGEMKRLAKLLGKTEVPADDAGRIALATAAANTFYQVIVLKGHRTVVTDGKQVYLNRTGNSALSKAGTGDVLSGITGSLLGQKMSPFDAACAATYLHGKAGELAGQKLGLRSPLAHDVIHALPQVLAAYEGEFGTAEEKN